MSDSFLLKLNSKFEIGLTPRFSGLKEYKISAIDPGFFYSSAWYRAQVGLEFLKSQYIHGYFDYFRVRTDLNYLDKSIDAIGYGLQYSIKFDNALVEIPPFCLYKKPIYIRWYPELIFSFGFMNISNESYRLSGLIKSDSYSPFYQYGISWNFYLNNWLNLCLLYLQEYKPALLHNPYSYYPLQIKIGLKL